MNRGVEFDGFIIAPRHSHGRDIECKYQFNGEGECNDQMKELPKLSRTQSHTRNVLEKSNKFDPKRKKKKTTEARAVSG